MFTNFKYTTVLLQNDYILVNKLGSFKFLLGGGYQKEYAGKIFQELLSRARCHPELIIFR